MESILEIPVFTSHPNLVEAWFLSNEKISLKKYNEFLLFDFEITADNHIYFYMLDDLPKTGNKMLLDQIITKTPFSFILVDQPDGIHEEKTRKLFTDYLKMYSTPFFFLAKKNSQELYDNLANDPLISDNDSALILFDPQSEFAIKIALLEAMKITLFKHTGEQGKE